MNTLVTIRSNHKQNHKNHKNHFGLGDMLVALTVGLFPFLHTLVYGDASVFYETQSHRSFLSVLFCVALLLATIHIPQSFATRKRQINVLIHTAITILFIFFSFGAPVVEAPIETLLFVGCLSCLCAGEWSYSTIHNRSHGSSLQESFKDLSALLMQGEKSGTPLVVACFWGSVIGAWLGAFVIPLDWDRPWQQWPISCALGACWGYGLARGGVCIYEKQWVSQNARSRQES